MYSHMKYQVRLSAEGGHTLAATGDLLTWQPGYQPHYMRAVAAVIRNVIGATGTLNFDKRITIASDSGRVDNVAKLSLITAHVAGVVVYQDGLNVLVKPGEEIVVAMDDAAAAGDLADIYLWVEPSWERPANNTNLVATVNA